MSCLPDSKAKDSGFRKKISRIPKSGFPYIGRNRPSPSSPGPLFQSEGRCSAFDMEIIFHSHVNKTHFNKKGCAPSLILKARVFGTRMWPILFILHEMPLFPSLIVNVVKEIFQFFFDGEDGTLSLILEVTDKEILRQPEFVFIHIWKAMTIMFSWRRSAFSFWHILNFLNCASLRTADVFPVVASLTPKNKLETRAEKKRMLSQAVYNREKEEKWKTLCFVACSRYCDQGALIVESSAKCWAKR